MHGMNPDSTLDVQRSMFDVRIPGVSELVPWSLGIAGCRDVISLSRQPPFANLRRSPLGAPSCTRLRSEVSRPASPAPPPGTDKVPVPGLLCNGFTINRLFQNKTEPVGPESASRGTPISRSTRLVPALRPAIPSRSSSFGAGGSRGRSRSGSIFAAKERIDRNEMQEPFSLCSLRSFAAKQVV